MKPTPTPNSRKSTGFLQTISRLFRVGDFICLRHYNYVLTTEGHIVYIDAENIVLRRADGTLVGVKGEDINTFETDAAPRWESERKNSDFRKRTYEEQRDVAVETTERQNETDENFPVTDDEIEERDDVPWFNEPHDTEADEVYEPAAEELSAGFSLKVKDKIDLDELSRLDPKFRKRHERSLRTETEETDVVNDEGQENAPERYVRANGTVIKCGPVFGFISSPEIDDNAHFYRTNIADSKLYNSIQNGSEVVCTFAQTERGWNAYQIHSPGKTEELLALAEDQVEHRRYTEGVAIARHVLRQFPDDERALALVEEYGQRVRGLRRTEY